MGHKQVALDLAAFLDRTGDPSRHGMDRASLRDRAEMLFVTCYEDLGKKPRLLEADDAGAILTTFLPARLAPKDKRAEHLPAVLGLWFTHLEETEVVPQAFEVKRAFDEGVAQLVAHVRSGANAERQLVRETKPFVHGATKLGRNDPCSCGSGKKYKKCHGKGL